MDDPAASGKQSPVLLQWATRRGNGRRWVGKGGRVGTDEKSAGCAEWVWTGPPFKQNPSLASGRSGRGLDF